MSTLLGSLLSGSSAGTDQGYTISPLDTLLLGAAEGMGGGGGGGGASADATIHVWDVEVGVINEFDAEVGAEAVFEVEL